VDRSSEIFLKLIKFVDKFGPFLGFLGLSANFILTHRNIFMVPALSLKGLSNEHFSSQFEFVNEKKMFGFFLKLFLYV
jgi:hypothetical protein